MKKRRKISLILVAILSLALFVQNIQAIRVVKAAEVPADEGAASLTVDPNLPGAASGNNAQAGTAQTDDDAAQKEAEEQASKEAASREAEEQASREAASREAEEQASKEAASREAEEQASKEAASREAEEQASREAASKEQASREASEAEKRRQEQEAERERQRQEALEKAAKENEEAQKKQQEDEAAKAAEELAAKKEEEASKAAEESRQEKEAVTYKLIANPGSFSFGEEPAGKDRTVYTLEITNGGSDEADFTFSYKNKTGAFTCNLSSGQTTGNAYHLTKNGVATFNVSMKNNLKAGSYKDELVFRIANEGASASPVRVSLKGSVSGATKQIKSVVVSPQNYKLTVGDKYKFTAAVKDSDGNEKGVSQDVSWEVRGARSSSTKISSDGVLSIASDESSTALVIYAFSKGSPSVYGTSNVTPQRGGFNVTVAADPKDGGSVTGGGAVVQGGSVTLTAIPDSNYAFVGWVRDGKVVSTATNYTISNVQGSFGVTARFDRRYVKVDLERNNSDGGKVSGGGRIRYGESTRITARANDGYVFTGWKEDGKIISKDASYKLKDLKEDRKIKGMFEKTSHTITLAASPAEGGSVAGGGTFAINQGTTVKATPNSGYSFVGWEVNGQIVNRNATVKIDKLEEDYKCTAIFIKTGVSTFTISAGVATTGGTISPIGKSVVTQGQNVTYTITPKAGFAVLAVAVDGIQVGPVSSYTFSNVQGDHTIAAAFLQTDAGRAKASAAGGQVQAAKVQKIEKTEANTATEDATVSIDDALSGEGGDDYVEEMEDLESIAIPTDEELGVTEEDGIYSQTAMILGVSQAEAESMAAAGNKTAVARAAFYAGALEANAENQYEPIDMNGVDYTNMTTEEIMQVSDDDIYPSYTNLTSVVENVMTTDDLMTLVEGGTENVSVSLTEMSNNDVAPADEKIMKNAVGQKPLQYFDLSMHKTVNGYTENIHELSDSMEVVIEIPDEIYKSGKKYCVLRVHDGELKVLPDLDDDPKTITFRTDRFSTYAIAQEVASTRQMVMYFTLGALIALVTGLTCVLILILNQARARRARRRARAEQRRREIQY